MTSAELAEKSRKGEAFPVSHLRVAVRVVLVALAVRLIIAKLAFWSADPSIVLWPRGVEVLGVAQSLSSGNGFSSPFGVQTGPTAFVPPVYPAILALILKLFGGRTTAAAWVIVTMQCFFGAATCVPIYFLGLRTLGATVANRAALCWAFFPYAALLPSNIIWESCLSALLLATGVSLVAIAMDSESSRTWAMLGGFWGLSSLTNPALVLLWPAWIAWIGISRFRRKRIRPLLWGAAIFIVTLVPWSVRNYNAFHKWIPLRSNFALELWIGNHPGGQFGFHPEIHPAFSKDELASFARLGEIQYMDEKRQASQAYIRDNPALFVKRCFLRVIATWVGSVHGSILLVPVVSIFGLLGAWAIRKQQLAVLYLVPILFYPLPYYLTHPDLRYQHPLEPILMLLATYIVGNIFLRIRAHREALPRR